MAQERVQKQKAVSKQEEIVEEAAPVKSSEELKDELDELLDEIDSVLEVNAEEFVKGFIQKGGELAVTFWKTVKEGFIATRPQGLFKMRFLS